MTRAPEALAISLAFATTEEVMPSGRKSELDAGPTTALGPDQMAAARAAVAAALRRNAGTESAESPLSPEVAFRAGTTFPVRCDMGAKALADPADRIAVASWTRDKRMFDGLGGKGFVAERRK